MTTTRKPYGHLPKGVNPYLPRLVNMLKANGVRRPYEFIGELFNVSPSRIQQVVLAERRLSEGGSEVEVTQPADILGSRNPTA